MGRGGVVDATRQKSFFGDIVSPFREYATTPTELFCRRELKLERVHLSNILLLILPEEKVVRCPGSQSVTKDYILFSEKTLFTLHSHCQLYELLESGNPWVPQFYFSTACADSVRFCSFMSPLFIFTRWRQNHLRSTLSF